MVSIKTVDDYINSSSQDIQPKLKELRQIIKSAAPKSEEKISYGMPYYAYKGRLVYFGLHQNHIGLYIPPPIIKDHIKELKNYKTTISAIHLPLDQKLPSLLIKKLIKARIVFNENEEK